MRRFKRIRKIVRGSKILTFVFSPISRFVRFMAKIRMTPTQRNFDRFYKETFAFVREGSLVVDVPAFDGEFEIDFRSHVLLRLLRDKQYEPELMPVIDDYLDPHKDVLDVGANIGLFSILFSTLISEGNRVFAIEPTPRALDYLRKNILRNDCSSTVIVVEGVMTDRVGFVTLSTVPGMEEYSSLGRITESIGEESEIQAIQVSGCTVDNLVRDNKVNPGFIKIDTEGAEYLVLSGAVDTLRNHRPVILSELSDKYLATFGHSAENVVNLLERYGYSVFDALHLNAPISYPFFGEILAVPKEHRCSRSLATSNLI